MGGFFLFVSFLGNNAGSDFALWFLFGYCFISMSWFKKDRVCFVKNGFGFFLFFLGVIFIGTFHSSSYISPSGRNRWN